MQLSNLTRKKSSQPKTCQKKVLEKFSILLTVFYWLFFSLFSLLFFFSISKNVAFFNAGCPCLFLFFFCFQFFFLFTAIIFMYTHIYIFFFFSFLQLLILCALFLRKKLSTPFPIFSNKYHPIHLFRLQQDHTSFLLTSKSEIKFPGGSFPK